MRIFLLGATGKTGGILMEMALNSGHQVTGYVRSREKMVIQHKNLVVVDGNMYSEEQMAEAMKDHDVVVSCLGGNNNDKTTVIKDLTQVIVNSMKKSHVNRIIAISTAGIHDEFSWLTNLIIKFFYKHVINDHRLAAQLIMSSGMDYTLARPLSLTDGPLTQTYRKTPIGVPKGGKEISRQDLAHFLLNNIENNSNPNETVGLAY